MKIDIPLKDQVVSREVAPELNAALKKAGIEIDANYWWCYTDRWGNEKYTWEFYNEHDLACDLRIEKYIPTYTLPELMKLFPKVMIVPSKKTMSNEVVWAVAMKGGARGKGKVGLMSFSCQDGGYRFYKAIAAEVNLATALAKLVMWAIKKGHLSCIDGTQAG